VIKQLQVYYHHHLFEEHRRLIKQQYNSKIMNLLRCEFLVSISVHPRVTSVLALKVVAADTMTSG